MEKLSVVIITFNEQKNIGRCIDSVMGVADEIVVVDSLSTDNTKSICIEKKVRFIEHAFEGYGKQKNFALQQASYNHILSLDADEALSEGLRKSVEVVKQNNFPHSGYTMNRCTNYCGQWIYHGDWYPDRKMRVFDRRKIRWSQDDVHESTQADEGATFGHLGGDLLHYSYNNLEEHITQNNKYSSISAELYYKKGKRSGWFRMLVNPAWAFVHSYLIRLGFLDGFSGYIIAKNIAHGTFMKYYKLYALQKGIPVKPVV